jgi:hypothetical protein
MQSSSKPKKQVHYQSGTKGGKDHSHRSSRDSGVGSSSASDRASLGTAPDLSPFSPNEIEDQRQFLHSVQEALEAAKGKIKDLEYHAAKLDSMLKESNSENRLLKKEKSELFNQVQELQQDLDDERRLHGRMKQRESSPRTGTAPAPVSSSRRETERERQTTPPRPEIKAAPALRPILRNSPARRDKFEEERSQPNDRERRSSWRDQQPLYDYEQQPSPLSPRNDREYPNPFTPIPQSPAVPRSMPSMNYAVPSPVGYPPAPSHISYTSAPQYEALPPKRSSPPKDGNYHLYPL